MSHVRTSPYHPQSDGKIERYHRTVKSNAVRPKTPLTLQQAKDVVDEFVLEYNTQRLHSAIGYITPKDMLDGRQAEIHAERDRKLEAARAIRAENRAQERKESYNTSSEVKGRALRGRNSSVISSPIAEENTKQPHHAGPAATTASDQTR